jgi:hypothetical protein
MPTANRILEEPISPDVVALISGRELLIEQLGKWPTFHDFEVLSIVLERAVVSAATNDLRATFLVFDLQKAPSDPERRQGTAEFLFESIGALHIDGFNQQNPIIGLSITSSEPFGKQHRFHVEWGRTGMTHDVSFDCARIAVLRVVDLNPFRKALEGL